MNEWMNGVWVQALPGPMHLGQTGPVWPYWENGMEPIQTTRVKVYAFYYRKRWHNFNNIQHLQNPRVAGCYHITDIGIIYIHCNCLPSDIMNRPNHLLMNVLPHIAAAFQVPSHHSLHNMYTQVQQKMCGHTHGRPIYTTLTWVFCSTVYVTLYWWLQNTLSVHLELQHRMLHA
jgi:hypothetical protein